ncbi:hypothetical protein ACHQM5_000546 [Ranunculus cassubicifolius]
MALHQISLSSSPSMLRSSSPTVSLNPEHLQCAAAMGGGGDRLLTVKRSSSKRRSLYLCTVRLSLDATAGPVVGQVTEVEWWTRILSGHLLTLLEIIKVVVLDMYTQWCGPCKVMAPKYQLLSEKHLDVVFMKLDCNQENKALAKELGIRVVPTFKILKDGKFDDLVASIEIAKST